ncbi:MAG: hypothetical protein LBH04_00430 [Tannerellaceae bacterium]|nr:hypothetical protein [Tannerellaceae bacterium]
MNKFLMFTVALGIVFLSSCSNEEKLSTYSPEAGNGKLSFILPFGKKGPVTYGPVTGTDEEYEIKRLAIFWFRDGASLTPPQTDDILYKRFSYGDGVPLGNSITFTPSSGGVTAGVPTGVATIDIDDVNFPSKFFIIANVNGNSVMSSALSSVIPGTTTRVQFEQLMATAQEADPANSGDVLPIKCPLPMSINAASSAGGYIALADLINQSPQAHLKRRVARFDVINNSDFSNFKIKKIYVSRALTSGILQDKNFTGSSSIWSKPDSTGKFVVLDSLLDNNAPNLNGWPCVDKSIDTNSDEKPDEFQTVGGVAHSRDSFQVSPPAFYLWPTVIDKANQKTEIIVEGSFGTVERVYRLNIPGDTIAIEANKVYHIQVVRATKHDIDFQLTVEPWEDESTVELDGNDRGVAYSDIEANDDGVKTTLVLPAAATAYPAYEYSSKDSVTLTFSVTGTTTNGGRTGLVKFTPKPGTAYLHSDLAAMQDPSNIQSTTVVTYSSQYKTDYVVKLPPTIAPLDAIMTIANASNENDEYVTVELNSNNYDKTGYAPITFKYRDASSIAHTLLWAPLNVGATVLNESAPGALTFNSTSLNKVGYVYQWGRNDSLKAYDTADKYTTAGPVDSTVFSDPANSDKFFWVSSSDSSWRRPYYDDLWGYVSRDITKMRGPCPEGWRLPTYEEAQAMVDSIGSSVLTGNYRKLTLKPGSGGGILHFPVLGFRNVDGTPSTGPNNNCDYWTCSPDKKNTPAKPTYGSSYRVQGTSTDLVLVESYSHAYAFYIRAVRDITAP